uniref:Uncharacterized protein n=1 Tax=Daphnia galeata TaxID=27404 RepID=A0A8J2RMP2_9CRUS|nr:unnamed protein product [Daphnia galeata]
MKVKWVSKSEIALGLDSGTIKIYQIDENQPRVVRDMKWSDETQYLVSSSWDNTIRIRFVDHLNVEPIHGTQVNSTCYIYSLACCKPTNEKTHTESDRSVGLTGSISIWNPLERDEFKKLRLLQKHKFSVFSLAFSPDGHLLASSDAIEIIIWSTEIHVFESVEETFKRKRTN